MRSGNRYWRLYSGGPWTPLSLGAALLDMWDAERSASLDLSGSAVNSWTSVKNGYAASQAISASKPVWSATAINGRPALVFDGLDDNLKATGVTVFPAGTGPCELWALIAQSELPATTATQYPFHTGAGSFANTRGLRRTVVSGVNRLAVVTGSSATQALNSSVDASGVLVCRAVIDGTNKRLDLNNTAGSSTAVEDTGTTTSVSFGSLDTGAASAFSKCSINFMAVTSLLSASDAARMFAFLRARGGI